MMTELTATWGMEEGIAGKQDAVAEAMEGLEQCIKNKTQNHMKMVEDIWTPALMALKPFTGAD